MGEHTRKDTDAGFTLVELMVVVMVMAILLAIAVPQLLGARSRAQDTVPKTNLRNALTSARILYDASATFSGADATGMTSAEGGFTFVTGASTQPSEISVAANASQWSAAAMSASGTCWVLTTDGSSVSYGAVAPSLGCTGDVAATAATSNAWPSSSSAPTTAAATTFAPTTTAAPVLTRTNIGAFNSVRPAGTSNFTTSSFTPPANSLLIVLATYMTNSNTVTPSITLTDSGSHTWTQIGTTSEPVAWSQRLTVYRTTIGATPSAMTLTASNGGVNNSGWTIYAVAYTNYDASTPIGATLIQKLPGSQNPSLTLSASPLATSEVWAAVAIDEDDTSGQHVTPGTGWTEQVETVTYDPNLQVQTRTGSTSSSVSWNHLSAYPNGEGLVVALEIRSA
ncbi:MAG: type II secretion system protein [Acidimicrobiia bacterium]